MIKQSIECSVLPTGLATKPHARGEQTFRLWPDHLTSSLDHQLSSVPAVHLRGFTASFAELLELRSETIKAVALVIAARHGPGPRSLCRYCQAVVRTGWPRAFQLRAAG
jgi:hypothetical protein